MKKIKLTNLKFQAIPVVDTTLSDEIDVPITTPSSGRKRPPTRETLDESALPKFSLVAYTGVKVKTRSIPIPIVVDLSGIEIPRQKIPVRMEHKSSQGVGHTERIAVVGSELLADGVISRDTIWARDVKKSAINGFPWQLSMGGPINDAQYVPEGETVIVNGRTFEGELYVIRHMTLKEISFVDLAADSYTSAVVEAQFEEEEPDMDENQTISNSDPKHVEMHGEEAEKAGTPQPQAVVAPPPVTPPPIVTPPIVPPSVVPPPVGPVVQFSPSENTMNKRLKELEEKLLIDNRRIALIYKIGGGKLPDLEAKAIADGWSVEKFHAEFQAKTMPDASQLPITGATQNPHGLKSTTLEAIALSATGSSMRYLEVHYDAPTLEQIDKYRGVGIQEFCELSCGGKYLPKFRRDSRGWLEAAFSSMSLPGILSNVANKVLLEGFLTMDDTWRKICKIASCNNFQQHTRYRMNGMFKFEKVGPDGEIKHGSIDEQHFSQQLGTHGIMFALTRQMIIDDDLGAFAEIPRGIGIGAAEAISDAVWRCLLANNVQRDSKPFFSTDHKNIVTGADAGLSINGLTHAELAFAEQERVPGRPLGIPPSILLVPPALKVVAENLMKRGAIPSHGRLFTGLGSKNHGIWSVWEKCRNFGFGHSANDPTPPNANDAIECGDDMSVNRLRISPIAYSKFDNVTATSFPHSPAPKMCRCFSIAN